MTVKTWVCSTVIIALLASCEERTSMASETRNPTVEALEATLSVRVAGNQGSGNVMIALHGGPGQSHHYRLDLERLAKSSPW